MMYNEEVIKIREKLTPTNQSINDLLNNNWTDLHDLSEETTLQTEISKLKQQIAEKEKEILKIKNENYIKSDLQKDIREIKADLKEMKKSIVIIRKYTAPLAVHNEFKAGDTP